jgi:hypothetical protein
MENTMTLLEPVTASELEDVDGGFLAALSEAIGEGAKLLARGLEHVARQAAVSAAVTAGF